MTSKKSALEGGSRVSTIEHTLAEALSCLHDVEIALGSLIAERDALREDANRYRFLRDRMAVDDMPAEHPSWSTPSEEESRKFDAAVDAAIARAQGVQS